MSQIIVLVAIFSSQPYFNQINNSKLLEALIEPKYIALTFDDGPHPNHTLLILNELKKRQVKATFYLIGSNVEKHQEIVKQISDDGHEIGNHTYHHKNLTKCSNQTIISELTETSKIIEKITGQKPKTFRPPGGKYNTQVITQANNCNLATIIWTLDTRDWEIRNTDYVINKVTSEVKSCDVILLHDIHPTTALAVPQILDNLILQGFTFVTVSELIEINNDSSNKMTWKK